MNFSSKTEAEVSFDSVKQTLEAAFGQLRLLESGREDKYEGRATTRTNHFIWPYVWHIYGSADGR